MDVPFFGPTFKNQDILKNVSVLQHAYKIELETLMESNVYLKKKKGFSECLKNHQENRLFIHLRHHVASPRAQFHLLKGPTFEYHARVRNQKHIF